MKEEKRFYVSKRMERLQEETFRIQEEIQQLAIDVRLPEECRYMCYLLLEDPTGQIRMQKLLGYGEQKLAIGADGTDTSIGGIAGAIPKGIWKIFFGSFPDYVESRLGDCEYAVPIIFSDCVEEVTEPIGEELWFLADGKQNCLRQNYKWDVIKQTEAKWYKGDFHTHTRLSDGKCTHDEAMNIATEQEMNFYVPTEHNLMHTGWCKSDVCVIPGIEITTEYGHCNFFGITNQPSRLLDLVKEKNAMVQKQYVEEMISEANEYQWIVSLNHPFLTVWKWRFSDTNLDQVQCIEIINDPTYPDAKKSNAMAIRFLDALWNDGHRIYGVGGSDAHQLLEERYEGAQFPSVIGDPGTYVYAENLSPAALLEGVRDGHVYVSRFCTIETEITADGQTVLPGDSLPWKEVVHIDYRANIVGLAKKPKVFLVVNGTYLNLPVDSSEEGFTVQCQYCVEGFDWQWIRLEVQDQDETFLGYVNPISYGEARPMYHTFGEVLESMEGMEVDQRSFI